MENDDFPPTDPEAYVELEDAILWLERRSPQAARRFSDRVQAAVAQLAQFPESAPFDQFGARHLLLRPFRYEIIYVTSGARIERIIAFAETSRKPGYWADRLRQG